MYGNKPRILYLLRILQERADQEHPLTTNQIIEILKNIAIRIKIWKKNRCINELDIFK